jgi:hypothetical protein
MQKRELINDLFYVAYHSSLNPSAEIRTFLRRMFPAVQSKHLDALMHFCRPGQPEELPGIVYGMICEAWRQFLNEQLPV